MLSKKNCLKKQNDFKKAFKYGKYLASEFIFLKFLNNDLNDSRFGFIVSSKISKKAVERNKIKRRLRNIVRRSLDKIKIGYDIIVMTRPGIKTLKYDEIKVELLELFKKANLL